MIRDSVEYLEFKLEERDAKDITSDVVQIAVYPRGTTPTTWLPCTYVGPTTLNGKAATQWRTSTAVTWSLANYPLDSYQTQAKVTDTPESPRTDLGTLYIR